MKNIIKHLRSNLIIYLSCFLVLLIFWVLLKFIQFAPFCSVESFNWAEHLDYRYKPWQKALVIIFILIFGSTLFYKVQKIIRKIFPKKDHNDLGVLLSMGSMVLVGYIGYKITHLFDCLKLFVLEFFDLTSFL